MVHTRRKSNAQSALDPLTQGSDVPPQVEKAVALAEDATQRARSKFEPIGRCLNRLAGPEDSLRRNIISIVLAFILTTLVRKFCVEPKYPIFGQHLLDNLGPVERWDSHWTPIALNRIYELIALQSVWRMSGRAVDPIVLGATMSLISQIPLYAWQQLHFLIDRQSVFELALTDLFVKGLAGWVIGALQPRRPLLRKQPRVFLRHLSSESIQSIALAVFLGITFSGLTHYLTDRLILRPIVKVGIIDQSIPAYLSKAKPSFSFAIRHPKLPVPVLRSSSTSMLQSLLFSIPPPSQLALISLPLLVLPHWSAHKLAWLVAIVVGPPTVVTLWNLWPLSITAASVVGSEIALRSAAVAWLVTWVLDDVKRQTDAVKESVPGQVIVVKKVE